MKEHFWISGTEALFLVRPDNRVVVEVTKLKGQFEKALCFSVRSLVGEKFEQQLVFTFDSAIRAAERMANLTEPIVPRPMPEVLG